MLTTCPSCRHPYAEPTASGACPHCGEEAQIDAEQPSAVVAEGGEGAPEPSGRKRRLKRHEGPAPSLKEGVPLFERREGGIVKAFLQTFVDVVFRPRAFFGHLSLEGARGITWFSYICLLSAFLFDAVGTFLMQPVFGTLLNVLKEAKEKLATPGLEVAAKSDADAAEKWERVQQISEAITQMQQQIEVGPTLVIVSLLAAPLLAFFAIHLVSGLLHLTFRLLNIGGEPIAYEQTYRFVVYATAPLALGVLPGAALVSKIWFLVVLVIAMRRLHRPKALGVIAGILLPVIFLAQVGAGTVALVAESVYNWRHPPAEQTTEQAESEDPPGVTSEKEGASADAEASTEND